MNNLKYETFNPAIHDTRKVATLIYDVDFRTFDKLFKSETKAIDTIQKDLRYVDVNVERNMPVCDVRDERQ